MATSNFIISLALESGTALSENSSRPQQSGLTPLKIRIQAARRGSRSAQQCHFIPESESSWPASERCYIQIWELDQWSSGRGRGSEEDSSAQSTSNELLAELGGFIKEVARNDFRFISDDSGIPHTPENQRTQRIILVLQRLENGRMAATNRRIEIPVLGEREIKIELGIVYQDSTGHREYANNYSLPVYHLFSPPIDTFWLVACHTGSGDNAERVWCQYAHNAGPGFVRRMNNTVYDYTNPARNEDRPHGRLSTLDEAIRSFNDLITVNNSILILFWHGVDPPGSVRIYFGIIESIGRPPDLDTRLLENPDWDDRYFPFGWNNRNTNNNYRRVIEAIRSLRRVSRVYLYGCVLGQRTDIQGLLDFTRDISKEVWAYSGFTFTYPNNNPTRLKIVNVHDGSFPPAKGVKQEGNDFRLQTLETTMGKLPGWQMRGKILSNGQAIVEVFNEDSLGNTVEVWDQESLNSTDLSPRRQHSVRN